MRAAMKLFRNRKGATAIEYALIASLISIAALAAMQGMGTKIDILLNNTAAAM